MKKQLVYWDEDANGLPLKPVSTTLFAALEGALAGTLAFKNSENIVERTVRVRRLFLADIRALADLSPAHQFRGAVL